MKILLAEDNIVNQKIALAYLSQLGCQTDVAENGERMLQLLEIKECDVILMDCQMPLLDGYATTQAIRQLEATSLSTSHTTKQRAKQRAKLTVIVAITANAFKEDRDRCLTVGMDDYLCKPVSKQQLKKTLEYWLLQTSQDY